MPSDKSRLYVALYARGGQTTMPTLEDTYHWALIIGPKIEAGSGDVQGRRFHAREGLKPDGTMGWLFEEKEIPLIATQMLLVRICVGKIQKYDRTVQILRSIPVQNNVPGWNCVSWVKEALEALERDGKAIGTGKLDWTSVRNGAMSYVERKKRAHRFDGQGSFDMTKPPTYNLFEGAETIP